MLVSLNWLKRYVDIKVSPQELCEKMTMAGFEIESMEDLSQSMRNVVVGRIEKLEKHPDADKLQICQINIGTETVQIVTGAQNVFEGALVPAALDHSLLPTGQEIKAGKLRGVASNGMLCSGEELCVTEEEYSGAGVYGILIFKEDYPLGTDVRDIFGRNDCVIDFKITPNRPDCLSVLGIAREVAAVLKEKFTVPDAAFSCGDEKIQAYAAVQVHDSELCPRYMAMGVKNIKIAPSPKWMCDCLIAAGMRPINNIVDITNFVMLETGHPMHAFDMRDISGRTIHVRRAKDGERLVTLDEKEHALTSDMLVIADEERAIGLAGIMGGLNSEIKEDTSELLFEVAKFKRDNIRKTAKALGMRTEASSRFEKGVDIAGVEYAMKRAVSLVQELGAGEIVVGAIDVSVPFQETRTMQVSASRINQLLGIGIPAEDMVDIFNRLELCASEKDGMITCRIPAFREDIEGAADLAEEAIRIYGYEYIEGTPLRGVIAPGEMPALMRNVDKIKEQLVRDRFCEITTFSFISAKAFEQLHLPPDDKRRAAVQLLNPLGEDYSVMRTQLYHSMMNVIALNSNRGNEKARLFECSRLHFPKALPVVEQPEEIMHLCMGEYGEGTDFFTLKSSVEGVLALFGLSAQYVPSAEPFMHPGRQADICVGGEKIGALGQMHPLVCEAYGAEGEIYCAQLNVELLASLPGKAFHFRNLPKYPAVYRDLAVVMEEAVPAGEALACIEKAGGALLQKAELFDVYRSELLGGGKKSMAFSLEFRSDERTLTVDEVAKAFDKIVRSLEYKLGAKLR